MKIIAHIPVERVQLEGHYYTFLAEPMECEVVKVLRIKADRTRERYYYEALVVRPARMHPESGMMQDGLARVSIRRGMNPKWKPPVFPDGQNIVAVEPTA